MLVAERDLAAECERIERAEAPKVDCETNGLHPWLGHRAVGVAVAVDGRARYFAERHAGGGNLPAGSIAKVVRALRGKRIGGWCVRFDLTHLSYEDGGDWCLAADAEDGIVDAVLLDENHESYSLEAAAERALGPGGGESKRKMDARLLELFPKLRSASARKAALHELPAAEVAEYACGDVLLPEKMAVLARAEIERQGLGRLSRELQAYNMLLARMQDAGVLIDADRCRALSAGTADRQAATLAAIRAEAGPTFNPGSWQQVTRLLGTKDARQKTLGLLDTDLARRIVGYKKLGKAKAAYYDRILELLDTDDYLHPQLNLTRDQDDEGGARTGRLSCSDPNFQALPHADDDPDAYYKVRDLVVTRPGYKLAKLDYERAEMYMAGSYCDEPALAEVYHAGRNLYKEIAAEQRITYAQAKFAYLSMQYGIGKFKLAREMGWSVERAEAVRQGLFRMCPRLRRALWAYSDAWKERGILHTWAGRPLRYSGDKPYAAWNRVIQGGVSDMIRVAMQRLEPVLAALDSRLVLQVHDEIVVEYPEEREEQVLSVSRECMTDFPNFKLRPRVDVKTSAVNYARCV